MATRFFLPASGGTAADVVTAAYGASWDHVASARKRKLLTAIDGSALETVASAPDGADHLTDEDNIQIQYLSGPIAAQTISAQTVKIQVQGLEYNNGNNLFLAWEIFVVSNDGATRKETLLALKRDGTEVLSTLINRSDSATTTSATVEDGDRIVLEVGYGGLPVNAGGTQSHNCDIRIGCVASSGDLLENDTEAGSTYRPWLEFANTITFQSVTRRVFVT